MGLAAVTLTLPINLQFLMAPGAVLQVNRLLPQLLQVAAITILTTNLFLQNGIKTVPTMLPSPETRP